MQSLLEKEARMVKKFLLLSVKKQDFILLMEKLGLPPQD
jgi:hypothetical protein